MDASPNHKNLFTIALMQWHGADNNRSLPWKQEKDPYKIWLSEIILQQTRAQQGLPYYNSFINTYPAIQDLANANDDDVFRLWQGLGYYNRCRNMLATARFITNEYKGKFPDNYEAIINLKGIGAYTAAAIASFAFRLPYAVVDGNVYRVLARNFGIDTPFDTNEGKKQFQKLANELLDKTDSPGYNQAIMDLGATVCVPANPKCVICPLQTQCIAYNQNLIPYLPVRSKKQSVKNRYFHYLFLLADNKMWLHKRMDKDIWQNLYEPYLIEHPAALDTKDIMATAQYKLLQINEKPEYGGSLMQRLTHQLIETRFFTIISPSPFTITDIEGNWVNVNELKNMAFPKTLVTFLEKNLYF